jgi:putative tryptophan/tyrosine transport system substrate-binding protein
MKPVRRHLLIAGAAGLASAQSWAQTVARPARIGWPASVPIRSWALYPAFTDSMRQLGWVEGRDYVMDDATYEGRAERIPGAVAELMARKPDLLVGSGTPPMRALMAAASTIPIVMYAVGDPVGQGFVQSLARTGGNVTGLSALDHGMLAKQFELLLQAVPRARRIGVTYHPDIPLHVMGLREVEAASARFNVQVRPVALRSPAEVDAAIDTLRREQVDAVHFFVQTWINTGGAERLARIALQQRWPSALGDVTHVRAGILLAYGWQQEHLVRRLPHYIDRILKGTPPGELPVEQPTRFYTTINLKTARALGLTLPQSLLLQATEVVE